MAVVISGLLLAAPTQATTPCPLVTHSGTNYSGKDLQNQNFSNQNLTGANFTNAKLQGTVFTGATLIAADFTGAELGLPASGGRPTSFSRAELTNACFYGASVASTDFQFANLRCTVFDNTDLTLAIFGPILKAAPPSGPCRTSFQSAVVNCEFIPQWKDLEFTRANVQACYERLKGVDFTDARMNGVVFSGLDLSRTKWVRAHLQGAFFLNAKLNDAVMSAADLRRAQLSQVDATGATLDNQTQLSGAHLSGAILKGVNLTSAILQGADGLPAADLSLAFMPDAVLTDAKLTGVNMSHANFYGALAKADNATMQQMDFSNANLGSLNLTQGRLRGAKLDAADLVNAILISADLTATPDLIGSSLVQANLQGADFTKAQLGGANLSNAAVSLADGVVLFTAPTALSADLDRHELSSEVVSAFSQSGYHLVDCSDPAVYVDQLDSRWQIWLTDPIGPSGARYEKFALANASASEIQVSGLTSSGSKPLFKVDRGFAKALDKKLLASGLLAAFRNNAYPLPPCFNPLIDVVQPGARWTVGESLSAVTVAGLGYTGFNLVVESSIIRAYGSEVTIIRRDEGGGLTLVPIPLQPTKLVPDAFDDNTTCPNQKSYGANKASGATWQQMMTAVSPPPPPPCIPSPTHWCS